MSSKMVAELAKESRALEAAARKMRGDTGTSLEALWASVHDGNQKPALSEEERILAIGRWLARNRERMTAADGDLETARRKIRQALAQLAELTSDLRHRLMDVRRNVEGTYGRGQAEILLGLGSDVPQNPKGVKSAARALVRRLDKPGFALPEPRLRGCGLETTDLKAEVVPALERLETCLRQLAPWRRGEERALQRKRKNYEFQKVAVGRGKRYLQALCALAGEDFPDELGSRS